MNQKTLFIGAVVVLALIGLVLYTSGFFSDGDNEFDLDNTDDNLEMKSKIDLALVFEDGSKKTVTGSSGETLAFEYNGTEITQVEWKLSVQANTPTGREAYEMIRVTSTPTLESDYTGSANEDVWLEASCYFESNEGWGHTYTQSNPNTFTMQPDTGLWKTLLFQVIEMDTVFNNWVGDKPAGTYFFTFNPGGFASYRGESQYGNGEWQDVNFFDLDMQAGYEIEYINEECNVNFDSEVIFS